MSWYDEGRNSRWTYVKDDLVRFVILNPCRDYISTFHPTIGGESQAYVAMG